MKTDNLYMTKMQVLTAWVGDGAAWDAFDGE